MNVGAIASHVPTHQSKTHTTRGAVQVFRDLTRNRESFRERKMEHDTFVTNLPRVRLKACVGPTCVYATRVNAHMVAQLSNRTLSSIKRHNYSKQALQQYEEEQEMARKQGYARNPLVRDQATLIIDKVNDMIETVVRTCPFPGVIRPPLLNQPYTPQGDASNRRWLSGAPEGAVSSNWAEREAMAQKERLSGVEGTIVRWVRLCWCGVGFGGVRRSG